MNHDAELFPGDDRCRVISPSARDYSHRAEGADNDAWSSVPASRVGMFGVTAPARP